MIIEVILAILSLLTFYVSTSLVEGALFHLKAKSKLKIKNQHFYLVAMRIPFWVLFYLVTTNVFLLTFMVMIFPFIHDGVYYWTRNKLNPDIYPKGFWDEPDPIKSDAVLDFTLKQRIWLAILGSVILIISFII
jgi:hypothetical protein